RGQVVAVFGEPGVGKSRLVWEITHAHRADDWLILEASESSGCGGLKARADRARADELEDLNLTWQALHPHRAEGQHLYKAFGERESLVGEQDSARGCHLLHSGGQVRSLTDGGVVHAEVRSN